MVGPAQEGSTLAIVVDGLSLIEASPLLRLLSCRHSQHRESLHEKAQSETIEEHHLGQAEHF